MYSLQIVLENLSMRHYRKCLGWMTSLSSGKVSRRKFQGIGVLSLTLTMALENDEFGKAYLSRTYLLNIRMRKLRLREQKGLFYSFTD